MFRTLPRLFTAAPNASSTGKTVADKLKIGRLNHVAIAVSNLEEASSLYRDILGADVSEPVVRLFPYLPI